jgi:hypothetical protein
MGWNGIGGEEGEVTKVQGIPPQDLAAVVVRVEVHVEGVDDAVSLVVHNHGGRHGVGCGAAAVGLGAFYPGRVLRHVVFGCEVHIAS